MPKAVHLICIFVLIKYLMTYHKCYSVVSVARPSRVCILSKSPAIAGGGPARLYETFKNKNLTTAKEETLRVGCRLEQSLLRTDTAQLNSSRRFACSGQMINVASLTLIALVHFRLLTRQITSTLWTYNRSHPRCHWYIQPTRRIPLLAGRLFM